MKIHWGFGVVLLLGGFMVFMGTLVYKCVQQRIDLVSNNYYEQEIKYQAQIEKEKNTLLFGNSFAINYDATQKLVIINFPSTVRDVSGSIRFFKPDNAALDFSVPVRSDKNSLQVISVAEINTGLWNVKVDWQVGSTPYYGEKKILI